MDVTADHEEQAARIVTDGVEEGPVEAHALGVVVMVMMVMVLRMMTVFLVMAMAMVMVILPHSYRLLHSLYIPFALLVL